MVFVILSPDIKRSISLFVVRFFDCRINSFTSHCYLYWSSNSEELLLCWLYYNKDPHKSLYLTFLIILSQFFYDPARIDDPILLHSVRCKSILWTIGCFTGQLVKFIESDRIICQTCQSVHTCNIRYDGTHSAPTAIGIILFSAIRCMCTFSGWNIHASKRCCGRIIGHIIIEVGYICIGDSCQTLEFVYFIFGNQT